MKTQIKAFYAAHKTGCIIAAVVLVIAAGINANQQNQGYGQGMYGQRQQYANQQGGGFWSKMFGGSTQSQQPNYNGGGYSGNGNYASGNGGSNAGNSGADYTSGYAAQQASNDRTSENFSDYMRDQGNYEDGNGNTYKLSSNYSNNYVNSTTGEYVQSNDANYDPNAGSTSTWTSVTPSSSYSSSSSSTTESGE